MRFMSVGKTICLFFQDDIRCVKKETEKTENDKKDLTSKIQELQLFIDTSEKEQKKRGLKKQVNNPSTADLCTIQTLIILKPVNRTPWWRKTC